MKSRSTCADYVKYLAIMCFRCCLETYLSSKYFLRQVDFHPTVTASTMKELHLQELSSIRGGTTSCTALSTVSGMTAGAAFAAATGSLAITGGAAMLVFAPAIGGLSAACVKSLY